MEKVFNNQYLIKNIFSHFKRKLRYLNINKSINKYLFDNVLVEFSMEMYIKWLINSNKLIYFDSETFYIPSKVLDDLDNLLQYLEIKHFKRIRLFLTSDEHKNFIKSTLELNRRLNYYLIAEQKMSQYFPMVEELVLNFKLLKVELPNYSLKYLDCQHTNVDLTSVSNQLQTLIIDIKNLSLHDDFSRLKHLKILDSPNSSFNYERYFKTLNWKFSFPNLKILYLSINHHLPSIDLSELQDLETVYAYQPSLIKLPTQAKFEKVLYNFESVSIFTPFQ